MKKFYSKEDNEVAEQVRHTLLMGEDVEWCCTYETFYGTGWLTWVKEQIADIPCEIKSTKEDNWLGYTRDVVLVPKPF